LYEAFGDDYAIRRISRFESASPATGSHAVHVQEQDQIVDDAVIAGV
jgi:2-oxoglutarate dehydrogenase complex dehydrogenase (E1) component-like enzyme